jgi:hypothetical protein
MNELFVIAGAAVLVAGIFGFTYSAQQQNQGLLQQGQDAVQGEQTDWSLVQSGSIAGMALGMILLIAGITPKRWYEDQI